MDISHAHMAEEDKQNCDSPQAVQGIDLQIRGGRFSKKQAGQSRQSPTAPLFFQGVLSIDTQSASARLSYVLRFKRTAVYSITDTPEPIQSCPFPCNSSIPADVRSVFRRLPFQVFLNQHFSVGIPHAGLLDDSTMLSNIPQALCRLGARKLP
jgi:hypothetical protein